MTDEREPIITGTPESFGWVRKPELDTDLYYAWERPDGSLYAHPKDAPALVLRVGLRK